MKDEQINYLLADVEKSLGEYKIALELKEKQILDAKKILLSAKRSYDKTVAENRELKAYLENLKQHIQKQQVQFLEKQRNYYHEKKLLQKNIKKWFIKKKLKVNLNLKKKKNKLNLKASK